MLADMVSSTSPFRQMIRSCTLLGWEWGGGVGVCTLRRREKMSSVMGV